MYQCPNCTYYFTRQESVLEHCKPGGECDQRKAWFKQWCKEFDKKFPAEKKKVKKNGRGRKAVASK